MHATERLSQKRGNSPLVIAAAIFVPLLPVLYVLSSGPAEWLQTRGYIRGGDGWTFWFYLPLNRLMEVSHTFKAALLWYLSVWE